jgi:hypothetical protein
VKGYGVHLLFHLLALAVGAALGVAVAMWWLGHSSMALWLALASIAAAILVLALQAFYIAGSKPPAATGFRPRPAVRGGTSIRADPTHGDGRTRASASEPLHEHGQA